MEEGVGGGGCCSAGKRKSERIYKGIRMRKWGKWVAEIREPNKRSRIWLGSYSTPVAAARAYDTAVYYLRGPSARLNFPELLVVETTGAAHSDLSAAAIRKKAIEVGSRVDALQGSIATHDHHDRGHNHHDHPAPTQLKPCWFQEKPDLNVKPEPEDPDVDYW
ncbi:hypothetical protein ACH5RR_011457 [Cinchona calisaya]|uniref:AP2/ERF domain-containing protein n=1 Tax=Cinchona calisaya TaxID=153742 RepID=A0ABD3A4Z0_9GENT